MEPSNPASQRGTSGKKDRLQELNGPLVTDLFSSSEGRLQADAGEGFASSENSDSDMEREELKAHLKANEAEVREMTARVEGKLDARFEQFNSKAEEIATKHDATNEKVSVALERLEEKFDSTSEQIALKHDATNDKVSVTLEKLDEKFERSRDDNVWTSRYVKGGITFIGIMLTLITLILGALFFLLRTLIQGA